MLLRPEKLNSKKHSKITFLQRGHSIVFVKKWTFFLYVFFDQKSQQQTVFDILDTKECFLDLRSEVLKKSRKSTFCKGVSPWFLSKKRPFCCIFFSNKAIKKTFFDILDSEECFLDLKN